MFKKIYLFLILIFCLFVISAVSAEDNSTSDIISVSNDVNSLEANILESNINTNVNDSDTLKASNDDVLTAGNNWYVNSSKTSSGDGKSEASAFKTLNEALNKASNDDTIMIASGEYKGVTANIGLDIDKPLNFIKYGDADAIFDAESKRRIWTVTTNFISITGLTFKNGKTGNNAGAIYWKDGARGTINNCTFINNTAYYGGAIRWDGADSTITNCNFIDNTAVNYGGAIRWDGADGTINNCNFIDNTAYYGGAIRWDGADGTITNCNFAGNNGSAIDWNCVNGVVSDCNFTGNTVKSGGGAIRWDGTGGTITNCNFIDNTATKSGGAIYWTNGADNGNIINCNFINNTATKSAGAILWYNGADSTIYNCTFINNTAYEGGGAIYWYNSEGCNVSNCALVNNNASTGSEIYSTNVKVNLDYNWWGSNNPNWTELIYGNSYQPYVPSVYAVLNITANPVQILPKKESIIKTNFVWKGTNTDATNSLPKRNVKLTSDGTLTETEGDVGLTSQFSANTVGIYYVKATVDNEIIGVNVKVTLNPNVIIDAPDVTKYYGGSERFIVTLTDLNGNPIKNAVVKITINGRPSNRTTDDNGIVSMGINLNSGVYITTTEYNGTKVNSTVTVKDTVIAKDFSKIFRNGTQYQGTFVDSQGNLIRNTDIEININGVFYIRKTNDNGVAQMNINLPPGTYILTATNPLSGEQHTTKVTVLPNIVENNDLTKYYKNASQYSLRLLDDKGNPVGAGVSIQLNINGVFYTRTSDANGYVKMNINLPPGTYIITAEYKGLKASNTINVLSILQTKDLSMKYRDGSKFEAKILNGQGKPYAGQTVTFNINGVFYKKTTNADGIASLNINLPAGNYIITSSYNGLNGANSITISYDFWHLPDSTDPYPEVGRINYGDGWVGQIYNDNYKRTINLNTLEVYGSYGDFTELGIVMVADDGRYYYYDNGDFAYHGENYDSFDYHTDVQWWYNNLPKSVNPRPPLAQYFDILGPNGANGYVYYPDGTYEHFVNDVVVDGTHYVDKSY